MKYNKTKHLNLLKYSQELENQEKTLSDEDFLELQEYRVRLISHLHWQNQEHYFELIEELLNGPIGFLKLRKKHRAINDAVERLEADLILFEPDDRSEDFDDLISERIMLFDRYCPDPSIREDYEFSEEQLKDLVQKIFIEMKNRYS